MYSVFARWEWMGETTIGYKVSKPTGDDHGKQYSSCIAWAAMLFSKRSRSVQQAFRVHVDPAWCLKRRMSMQHRAMMARRSLRTWSYTSVAAIAAHTPLDRSPYGRPFLCAPMIIGHRHTPICTTLSRVCTMIAAQYCHRRRSASRCRSRRRDTTNKPDQDERQYPHCGGMPFSSDGVLPRRRYGAPLGRSWK
jgi:hypothetical protein